MAKPYDFALLDRPKLIDVERRADAEMKEQIMTGCGAFHRSPTAFVWTLHATKDCRYFMTKVPVNRDAARAWMVEKLTIQVLAGMPPNINWKTELCTKLFTEGKCNFPDCEFAHSIDELQSVLRHRNHKMTMCHSFKSTGYCRFNNRCRFRHTADVESFLGRIFSASEFLNTVKLDTGYAWKKF